MCSQIFTPGAEVSIGRKGPPFFSLSGLRSQISRWLGPPDIQRTMQLRWFLRTWSALAFSEEKNCSAGTPSAVAVRCPRKWRRFSSGRGRDAAEITGTAPWARPGSPPGGWRRPASRGGTGETSLHYQSVDQDKLIRIEQCPEQVLKQLERVRIGREIAAGLLELLAGRVAAQGREVNLVDHVGLGRARLSLRLLDTAGQEAAGLAGERIAHELAVHHHERLGDCALKIRGLFPLVIAEGEEELPQPGVSVLIALNAVAGAMGVRRGQQRVEELLWRHGPQLHEIEQAFFLFHSLALHTAGLVSTAGHDPADQLLHVITAFLELARQLVQELGI